MQKIIFTCVILTFLLPAFPVFAVYCQPMMPGRDHYHIHHVEIDKNGKGDCIYQGLEAGEWGDYLLVGIVQPTNGRWIKIGEKKHCYIFNVSYKDCTFDYIG